MHVQSEAVSAEPNAVEAPICVPLRRFVSQQVLTPQLLIDSAECGRQLSCPSGMQKFSTRGLGQLSQGWVRVLRNRMRVQREDDDFRFESRIDGFFDIALAAIVFPVGNKD